MKNIRNFSIIAHIDHGKSTLADRMLEITGTVEKRKMHDQVLDSMELERERGITIKMQPVRMLWHSNRPELVSSELVEAVEGPYILNLIDTPGHIDFSYEVSRALSAVEGAILLVDATQGIQAQTLSVLNMAREQGLVILPALSKVDSPLARADEVKKEIVSLLDCKEEDIVETSGKTGEGVEKLLSFIVEKIPPPQGEEDKPLQALVFDFKYSEHRGIIVFVRIINGGVKARDNLVFRSANQKFVSLEVGIFKPEELSQESLRAGEIGYIVTGVKTPGVVSVGDTVGKEKENGKPLWGFNPPAPVVWASFFPEDQGEFNTLKQALLKLKLLDSSLFFEEESSGVLGKGFRCGFLGMLHLEIVSERLKREFGLNLVITQPSITYEVVLRNGKNLKVFSPAFFPEDGDIERISELWMKVRIILPPEQLGIILPLLYEHEAQIETTKTIGGDKTDLICLMPLRELMRGFFDKLKSVSKGYASLSYEEAPMRDASVTKLSVLINDEEEISLARVVSKRSVEREAENLAKKLKEVLPRQMFELKIQAKALGRIIASERIAAFRKDVTQHMYGGDITRKMKLREKQKKGKKKMRERGKLLIPHEVFVKIMKP
jgi:GTP-binding protein LepA